MEPVCPDDGGVPADRRYSYAAAGRRETASRGAEAPKAWCGQRARVPGRRPQPIQLLLQWSHEGVACL